MNTIWLKLAAAAVAIVIVLVVVGRFWSSKPAPEPAPQVKTKTFDQMAERDKQFNEAPKPVEPPAQEPAPQPQPQPAQQPAPQPTTMTPAQQLASRPAGIVYPSDIKTPTTLYFKPMSEEDDIQAQQILPYATAGRSIGRLPIMQYGLMNKACLQIEERWPDSWYCFRAKQMLEEITQYQDRYAQMYKITPQRLDISRFMKKRPGTEARTVEPIRR
jgi:hypothetical protein